ncbi:MULTISPECIES: DUF427 domain-containing protein [unclassified Arthrobacter]|uniref:DUF427 domain-containing protein n=1 Tax=unclassified Arthrobacter TaxID=235627 RepID=UPI001E52E700|nr:MULTISPECIES: DUF427 domain-containing protein [unclassified Arthrobacter]MCC9145587.1 DUF427 domain-containing protein [Arthrobacter sp. zg-Y919]MDK1276816.1 DUF427 domain-containing protein [Arthrobacter sp. zg.Y919]WIB04246.1 DUF427 domain-containing protein [Arthrobacter sp. zg-Y919]
MALHISPAFFRLLPELRYEPTPRRIRAQLGGNTVVDSTSAVLAYEPRRVTPIYAVPAGDIAAELTFAAEPGRDPLAEVPPDALMDPRYPFSAHTAPGQALDLRAGLHNLPGAGFRPDDPDLAGYVLLDFTAFDRWLEEDTTVEGHPRDPFHRVDARDSSRAVRVHLDGQLLAETRQPLLVYETMLPPRTYFPRQDVDWDVLDASLTRSVCPYKGTANYWSVAGHARGTDLAWSYEVVLPDSAQLKDRISFFDERTEVYVDDAKQEIDSLFRF